LTNHDSYASLRVPNFRRLILAYATSSAAREAQIVVVGWQVYEITRDPLALGLIGLAEALPFIAMALYAGHIADRMDRRAIALAGTFSLLLSAIALLAFTLLHMINVWPIYAVIFLSGIGRSFTRPAVQALSADLVPRDIYPNAVAWRSSTWQFAAVFGPAVGGMLYGFAGPAAAYAVVCVFMAISIVAIAWIRYEAPPRERQDITISESLAIGLRFVWNEPVVLAAMTLDLFAVLFGGAAALLPIFAHMLGAGPQGLGVLRAAPAVGSFFMGLYLAHRSAIRRAGLTLFVTVGVFGLCIIAFALSTNFYLSLALLTLSGMADQISVVIRGTLIQIATPPHLLGRVAAVNGIFIGSSNEIGAFESGVAARIMGTVPSVIFGGVMTLVVVGVTAMLSPRLRQLRELS
jgi:MFS family permease